MANITLQPPFPQAVGHVWKRDVTPDGSNGKQRWWGFAGRAPVSACFGESVHVLIVITEHESTSLDVISKLDNFNSFSCHYFIEPCVGSVRPQSQACSHDASISCYSCCFKRPQLSVSAASSATHLLTTSSLPCYWTYSTSSSVIVAGSVVFPMGVLLLLLLLSLPKAFNANKRKLPRKWYVY